MKIKMMPEPTGEKIKVKYLKPLRKPRDFMPAKEDSCYEVSLYEEKLLINIEEDMNAKQARKLADWLNRAADYLESKKD